MSIERFLYGLAPAVAGVAIILATAWSIARSPRIIQFALGVPTFGLTIFSLWMIWRIWHGAWPSYLPLVLVVALIPITAAQVYLATVAQRARRPSVAANAAARSNAIPKVYLDNNVVSSIAKDDTPTESDAIDRLLVAREASKVELVTSDITLDEIKRYAGPWRKPVERMFRVLEKVPVVSWDELVGMHSYGTSQTWITSPLIENDPLYDSLLKLGLEVIDARHVFVAAKQGCTAFLTCDGGVLARAADIRNLCGVTVQRPSAFVKSAGW